jgi:ABC-type polysaccharide/polyol phosphate transport system ATPase subunit
MASTPLIAARGLGKKFCRDLRRSLFYGLRDLWAEVRCDTRGFGELRPGEFWALQDAAFDLHPGQNLGIIGHNGSGKSTLLKLIAGLIKPDRGELRVRGRVGALIALGAGFNPVLTGRENIRVNAAVLGYTSTRLNALVDEIVAFSELEDFIDSPVQNYSSGMYVRLGFAVAAHFAPDIMLVDEVLAVGDAAFQRKCFERIRRMRAEGTGFVVVSHNPWQIEHLCDVVAVIDHGTMSPLHPARDAQNLYHDLVQQRLARLPAAPHTSREGTHTLYFRELRVEQEQAPADAVLSGQPVRIVAEIECERPQREVRFRFEICTADNAVATMVTTIGLSESHLFAGRQQVAFTMSPCQLTSGWYYVNAVAVDAHVRLDYWPRAAEFKVVLRDERARALTSDAGTFVSQGEWQLG